MRDGSELIECYSKSASLTIYSLQEVLKPISFDCWLGLARIISSLDDLDDMELSGTFDTITSHKQTKLKF